MHIHADMWLTTLTMRVAQYMQTSPGFSCGLYLCGMLWCVELIWRTCICTFAICTVYVYVVKNVVFTGFRHNLGLVQKLPDIRIPGLRTIIVRYT